MADRFARLDTERRRELTEIRYVAALERGDFKVVAAVLEQALADPELDRRLAGIDLALHAEAGLQPPEEQARAVRELLMRHLPSGMPEPEEPEALTVGMVALRLAEEARGRLAPADRLANLHLIERADPITSPVTAEVVARVAVETDIAASEQYWEQFRRAAAKMAITLQHGEFELAAARSHSQGRRAPADRGRRGKRGRR